jgi:hypothetical protein
MIWTRCKRCGSEGRLKVWTNRENPDDVPLYCVKCTNKKCGEHTEYSESIEGAVDNWERGVYSKEVILMRHPLPTAEELDVDGVIRLCSHLVALLRKDYKKALEAYRRHPNESTEDALWIAERAIRSSFVVRAMDVDADDLIEKMKEGRDDEGLGRKPKRKVRVR